MITNLKNERPTRPVLRYHGGKWRLAQWILSHFPPHRVYVEPYGGAASVLLQKSRSHAEVYNDLCGEVCNLFRVLRDPSQARELERLLVCTPFARSEFEQSTVTCGDPIEQARRTIVRAFMGFASASASGQATGFRANSNRSHQTPAHDWANYPKQVALMSERFRAVVIENRPAVEVIRQHDAVTTLHYADPPYVSETRSQQKRNYPSYRFEMTDEDHRELAEALRSVKGMVVLSDYASSLYDEELYPDWHRVERQALADGARPRVEVLWLNARAEAKLKERVSPLFAVNE